VKYSHHIGVYVIHSQSACHPNRDARDYADEVSHYRPMLRKMEATHPGYRGTANHQPHLSNCVAQATLSISLLVRKYHERQTRQHGPSRNWIYGCLHQPEHHEVPKAGFSCKLGQRLTFCIEVCCTLLVVPPSPWYRPRHITTVPRAI
jgi:hypothetical protein